MKQSTLCDINSRSLPSRSSSVEGSLTPPSKGSYHALPEAVATQTKDNTNSRRMAKVKSESHASDQRKKSPYEVSETTRVTSEQNERRSIRHYVALVVQIKAFRSLRQPVAQPTPRRQYGQKQGENTNTNAEARKSGRAMFVPGLPTGRAHCCAAAAQPISPHTTRESCKGSIFRYWILVLTNGLSTQVTGPKSSAF